jgi:hypothetical protein
MIVYALEGRIASNSAALYFETLVGPGQSRMSSYGIQFAAYGHFHKPNKDCTDEGIDDW